MGLLGRMGRCFVSLCALAPGPAALLLVASIAAADSPQWRYQSLPFAQAMDLDAVYEVTHAPPDRLIQTIRRHGVEVLRVREAASGRAPNPLLASLPIATPEVLQRAEFQEGYEGRIVCLGEDCRGRWRDTIVIVESATSYTLLHEFVQSLLRPLRAVDADDEIEARFAAAFWRLRVYQRRLYDDPYRLLDPLWRRDILAAQADVAADLFEHIRLGQSQEAIVEKLLARYIDEHSPYYDAARRAQGQRYGVAMINNAIDVFNMLNDSVVFVETTVIHLREAMRDGSLDAGELPAPLTDYDVAAVAAAAARVRQQVEPVRLEIARLKAFCVR